MTIKVHLEYIINSKSIFTIHCSRLEVNSFGAGEHGGTHIDVPSHMIQDGKRLHEIPLDRMIGTGAWIDMSNTARYDRDLLMTIDDIVRWEDTNGRLPDHGILIVSFDWSYRYRDRTNYLGSIDPDDASTFHFPGIALEAARWLISNRNLIAIGIDTPSLDGGQGIDFMVHRTFLEYGILGLENLNLQKIRSLPPRGFTVFAIPMLIQDGSGAPLRAFAVQNTYYNRYSSLQYCP